MTATLPRGFLGPHRRGQCGPGRRGCAVAGRRDAARCGGRRRRARGGFRGREGGRSARTVRTGGCKQRAITAMGWEGIRGVWVAQAAKRCLVVACRTPLSGLYPLDTVRTLVSICRQAEHAFDFKHHFNWMMQVWGGTEASAMPPPLHVAVGRASNAALQHPPHPLLPHQGLALTHHAHITSRHTSHHITRRTSHQPHPLRPPSTPRSCARPRATASGWAARRGWTRARRTR